MLDTKILLGSRTTLLLAIIYTSVITVLLLMPSSNLPRVKLPNDTDKVVHLLIHIGLVGIWLLYLMQRNNNTFIWKHAVLVLLGSLVFGIVIEVLQEYLTESRTADLYDVLANMGGATVGVFVFLGVSRFFTP